jgi:cyanophycinase
VSGPVFGLLGSGEFEPWSAEVDRLLLERSGNGDGRVLIVPTASAPEGDDVFDGWSRKGLAHFQALGIPAEVAPIRIREDATRSDVVEALDHASVVYFSGGNPSYLAATMEGTPFWERVLSGIRDGLAYAGCSAGVACLTETTYDASVQDFSDALWKPGLGLVRNLLFGPHWNMIDTWIPGAREFILRSLTPGQVFAGIDEDTAMVGDGAAWRVVGEGQVHVLENGEWSRHPAGEAFELVLGIAG